MATRTRYWVASASYRAAVGLLVQARNDAGITQRDLATMLGKVPSWVAKVEQLERRLDIIEFIAVARALHADEMKTFQKLIKLMPKRLDI